MNPILADLKQRRFNLANAEQRLTELQTQIDQEKRIIASIEGGLTKEELAEIAEQPAAEPAGDAPPKAAKTKGT